MVRATGKEPLIVAQVFAKVLSRKKKRWEQGEVNPKTG